MLPNHHTKLFLSPLGRLGGICLVFLLLGIVFGALYQTSPNRAVDIEKFQEQFEKKEEAARKTLRDLQQIIDESSPVKTLLDYPFSDKEISYYVVEDNNLIFWSDNQLDISNITTADFSGWHYIELPNAYCSIIARKHENKNYIALITVKYNYPYENDKLINRFAHDFDIDERIEIKIGSETDKYAVFCKNGHYLFSLEKPAVPIYNELWSRLASAAYIIAFLIFFLLYARFPLLLGKKHINIKTFLKLFAGAGTFVALLLFFDIPQTFFRNELFTPFYYAYNTFAASIAHLSVLTAFVFSSVCLFFFFVKIKNNRDYSLGINLVFIALYPVYFLSLYGVLHSLVFHSCIQLNILNANDFSIVGVFVHFLLFVWGIGLALVFFKTHNYFAKNGKLRLAAACDLCFFIVLLVLSFLVPEIRISLVVLPFVLITVSFYISYYFKNVKYNYLYLFLWTLLYALFITLNLLELNIQKNRGKYRVLAQNVYVNGNVENDRIADILLEELDSRMLSDSTINKMVLQPDSIDIIKDYLDKTYFRGFWNKYDIQLNYASYYSGLYEEYADYIEQLGSKIRDTRFYSVPTTQNAMTYIGAFSEKITERDSVCYFLEFYPRRQYKSYSFPDLLIPASADIHKQLNVSVAKYDSHNLTYSSGIVNYQLDASWVPEITGEADYTTILHEDRWHYIYKPNDETLIVVSKQHRNDISVYIQFFIYLAFVYFIICLLLARGYELVSNKEDFRIGLAARFQYTFILLLIVSFVGIFYVSIDFIKKRYQKQQIESLENKRIYIQMALQEMYYWTQKLDIHNTASLNFDLQELSYTYQTDIHVFDNRGVLIGSSQPLIFYRNLISNRISPKPYFSSDSNMEQYEHVGELDYLAVYTDFYNGDYLQIGYIAVPQFFSQESIRAEIQDFSLMLIHIYFIVIIIAVFLTVLVGRGLSAPLSMLERKLKEMRIGQRNEKIEYKYNDEIGQLVAQYNRTVDELEQSAKLLAKSERESAWKSMARQVAHEINNPLTPMKLSIQQLQRRKDMNDNGFDEYFKNTTAMLVEQIDNLSRIAGTFSDFARMPEAKIKQVDVNAVLQSVTRLFANSNEAVDIDFSDNGKSVFIYADSEQLIQVFNNLIKNAIQSIPNGRKGKIKVGLNETETNIIIRISDNGNGVPKEIRNKMFVPNFTTKAQGMGLGLAISKNIVEQLGGTIAFETAEGKGSVFAVDIPKLEHIIPNVIIL